MKKGLTLNQIQNYFFKSYENFPVDLVSKSFGNTEPDHWEKLGEKAALKLFKQASERIPAYKDFLKKNRIKPSTVKTIYDFKKLPTIDKKNYLKKYPLESLYWDGKLEDANLISVSSGSTGKPFLWPRGVEQETETTNIHNLFISKFFEADKKTTLLIDGYSMGMYVAGVFTLNCSLRLSQIGYPLVVVTPGISKEDIIRIVKNLSSKFEQVVFAGYPPFVKDVIDQGSKEGINWKKLKVKFIFGAESFSESWRDYIMKKVGSENVLKGSMNTYGSADAAILGHETPVSIAVRRLADRNKKLATDLFGEWQRLPSFMQYYPFLRYFEVINEELHFSSHSGIPLVRYNMHDRGNLIKYEKMVELLKNNNLNIGDELKKGKCNDLNWKLPFVYLFGRSDFAATIYGLNVYPENIKNALENTKISGLVSGKFTMLTKNWKNQDQYLEINVEMQKGKKSTLKYKTVIEKVVIDTLRDCNYEYNCLFETIGYKKAKPEINLFKYEDPKYFSIGVKQKWSKKDKN